MIRDITRHYLRLTELELELEMLEKIPKMRVKEKLSEMILKSNMDEEQIKKKIELLKLVDEL